MTMGLVRELLYGIGWIASKAWPATGTYVLMYHSVGGGGPLAVGAEEFGRQMRYVKENYDAIPLSAVTERMRRRNARPAVCITFDDGLEDCYRNALPVLDRYSLPATFFITTGSVGSALRTFYGSEPCMTAGELRDLHARGYEIGAHTVNHPKLAHISLAAAREEIAGSKKKLEALIGAPVRSFAYPKGSYTDAVKKTVEECGLETAVTVREGACVPTADRFALPRIAVDGWTGRLQFRCGLSSAVRISGYLKRYAKTG